MTRQKKSEDEFPKYYCMFCGCKSYSKSWYHDRCPRCGTTVQPKKW